MAPRRHELTDGQWARLEPLLPKNKGAGRPWEDHRRFLNGMVWILRTGAPWRDLPERYGKFNSVHARFTKWRRDGTWDSIVASLQNAMDDGELLDLDLWCIDGSNVRATRAAAGAREKGGQSTSRKTTPSVAPEGGTERSCTS
jgi:transposase